jgi:hypothetical protein
MTAVLRAGRDRRAGRAGFVLARRPGLAPLAILVDAGLSLVRQRVSGAVLSCRRLYLAARMFCDAALCSSSSLRAEPTTGRWRPLGQLFASRRVEPDDVALIVGHAGRDANCPRFGLLRHRHFFTSFSHSNSPLEHAIFCSTRTSTRTFWRVMFECSATNSVQSI